MESYLLTDESTEARVHTSSDLGGSLGQDLTWSGPGSLP